MHTLIKTLKKYVSNAEKKLNISDDKTKENILEIEKSVDAILPQSFKELYSEYDGENDDYLGAILGFTFLSTETIIREIKSFKELSEVELMSMSTGKIKEGTVSDMKLVPFAFDYSRCYIALDMCPDAKGKVGQVIGIDYDYDKCYLISEDFTSFCSFIEEMLKTKKCITVEEEEDDDYHFEFDSGHFFNDIEEIVLQTSDATEIELEEGYFKEKYKDRIKDGKINSKFLQKETRLFIKNENLSLRDFKYFENLKELIIHNSEINNFENILCASNLSKIYIIGCKFDEKLFECLAKLPNLKELHIGNCTLNDISKLNESNSIKNLGFIRCENLNLSQITAMKKLSELEIERGTILSLESLVKMKKVKKLSLKYIEETNFTNILKETPKIQCLELEDVIIDNLDFLENMLNLKEFSYDHKVNNENGLNAISKMNKLTKFNYPVSEMKVYNGCVAIKEIGILENANDFESLQGSNVSCITIYSNKINDDDDDETYRVMDEVQDRVKPYIELCSLSMIHME